MSPQNTATDTDGRMDSGRVVVVTGGSRGIGRVCAVRLGRDGHAVVLNYAANAEEAEKALGQPSDLAGIVAFLSSPAGHWINGQVIRANGGLV